MTTMTTIIHIDDEDVDNGFDDYDKDEKKNEEEEEGVGKIMTIER